MRILIVEDDDLSAECASHSISVCGIKHDIATNGYDALDFLDQYNYICVVLDLMLPDISGLEITRKIREMGLDTHIVITTAKTDDDTFVKLHEYGADHFLNKPFHRDKLIAIIKSVVRRRQGVQASMVPINKYAYYDQCNKEIICNKEIVKLSAKEGQFFEALLQDKNRILSVDYIISKIYWHKKDSIETCTIRKIMSKLRKKMDVLEKNNISLENKRGVGYKLVC